MKKTKKAHLPQSTLPFGYTPEKLWTYNQLIEDNWIGAWYFENKQYKEAENFYRDMLGKFFKQQAMDGERYHKGLPYHNLAVALGGQGKLRESAKNFVLAYIEDALSLGEGADNFMAARALHMMGVTQALLEPIMKETLHLRKSQPLDAEGVLAKFQSRFEEVALTRLRHDDLLPLLSTESTQNLSSIVRIQTQTILTRMDQERLVSWSGLVVGLVSLVLAIISLVR